ncbi:MAG: hypothetical protein LBQ79_10690 [Deltaproteobacteria bacterium]|nr:hypothetical protein [Deltaproteobacteria bacterium]
MNAVTSPRNLPLPSRPPASRDSSLREELLGEIFGRGRERRAKAEAPPEPPARAQIPAAGKGHYVDLYV